MEFGVIYTADWTVACEHNGYAAPVIPRESVLASMAQTEDDDDAEYDYLGDDWEGHRHVKYIGVLTKAQMAALICDCSLWADDTETMGSVGVPWTASGMGWTPAISLDRECGYSMDSAIGSAYVTPLPSVVREGGYTERDWQRIRRVVIEWCRAA